MSREGSGDVRQRFSDSSVLGASFATAFSQPGFVAARLLPPLLIYGAICFAMAAGAWPLFDWLAALVPGAPPPNGELNGSIIETFGFICIVLLIPAFFGAKLWRIQVARLWPDRLSPAPYRVDLTDLRIYAAAATIVSAYVAFLAAVAGGTSALVFGITAGLEALMDDPFAGFPEGWQAPAIGLPVGVCLFLLGPVLVLSRLATLMPLAVLGRPLAVIRAWRDTAPIGGSLFGITAIGYGFIFGCQFALMIPVLLLLLALKLALPDGSDFEMATSLRIGLFGVVLGLLIAIRFFARMMTLVYEVVAEDPIETPEAPLSSQ